MVSSVHEVAQKDIIEVLNVALLSLFMRCTIKSKETHEIGKLAVNISKNFQRRLSLKDHRLAYNDLLSYIAQSYDVF